MERESDCGFDVPPGRRGALISPAVRPFARNAGRAVLSATNAAASLVGLKVIRANVLSEEWFRKTAHFVRMLDRVREVDGDVVECGVGAGKSFAIITSLVRSSGEERLVWGFSPWTSPSAKNNPKLSGSTMAEVRLRLRQMGVDDLSGIELVDGEFADTLTRAPEPIAFAYVDVVLEDFVQPCLERLWPKVAPGGVISIGWYTPHSERPVEAFLATVAEGEARLEIDSAWHGHRFLVKATA